MSFLDRFLKDEQDKHVEQTDEKLPEKEGPENNMSETTSEVRDYSLPLSAEMRALMKQEVTEQMREIYDPEIPVDIYELGLIYDIDVNEEGRVEITMTLTTPHCPVAESMPGEVQVKAFNVEGVSDVNVELVWDPPWTIYMMSEAARLEMGFM